MTEKDRKLLRENNQMLKYLIKRMYYPGGSVTPEDFLSNILANLISNRIDR